MTAHLDAKQALAVTLRCLKQSSGFTHTPVECHGAKDGRDLILSARDLMVGCMLQVCVDILLHDGNVAYMQLPLHTADCSLKGKGFIELRMWKHGGSYRRGIYLFALLTPIWLEGVCATTTRLSRTWIVCYTALVVELAMP